MNIPRQYAPSEHEKAFSKVGNIWAGNDAIAFMEEKRKELNNTFAAWIDLDNSKQEIIVMWDPTKAIPKTE